MKKRLLYIFSIILVAFAICGGGVFLATNTPISAENAVSAQEEEVSAKASGYWIDYGDSLSGYTFSRTGNVVNIYSVNDMAAALAGVNHNWYFTSDNVYLKNVNFVLKTDLDLSARWWTPMMLSDWCYFNGNGHKIIGAYVDVITEEEKVRATGVGSRIYAGFLATGIIKNVILDGWVRVNTSGWNYSNWERQLYIGGAVADGEAYNVINDNMDIFVKANGWYNNSGNKTGDNFYVGGIVGNGYASHCAMQNSIGRSMYSDYAEESYSIYVTGSLDAGTVRIGGIIGSAQEYVIEHCVSDARIYCGNLEYADCDIGGIVGSGTAVENCVVSERAYMHVYNVKNGIWNGFGGIIGNCWKFSAYSGPNLKIVNCFNYGGMSIVGDGACVGGVLGYALSHSVEILNCASFGSISSSSNEECGGIIGYHSDGVSITNSGFYGSVYCSGANAGGFVGDGGFDPVSITNSVVYGSVYATTGHYGAFVGIYKDVLNLTNCNDFRYYEYTSYYSGSGSSYNDINSSRWLGVWNSASSMVNQMSNEKAYSIISSYDANKDWIVIANGTCGFGNYKNTYCNQVYPYIMLPMKVFRPVTTYAFYRKPPESPSDANRDYADGWNQVEEANSFVSKSSSVGLFVNGVNRAVSFTMTNNHTDTFDVSGIWGGFMDTNTDPHLGTGATQKIVFEGGNAYTLVSWSFSSTKSGQTRSFTTDLFWSGDANAPLMIHFYLECKAKKLSITNDSAKGDVVVKPKGSNRTQGGNFYYNDKLSYIVVTPKVGYYVKSVKWNTYTTYKWGNSNFKVYDSTTISDDFISNDIYGIVKVDKGWTIPLGLKAEIVVEYEQVTYTAHTVAVWDDGGNYNNATLAPDALINIPVDVELGYKYRVYFKQNSVDYGKEDPEEVERNAYFKNNAIVSKNDAEAIVALDGGGENYRGITIKGNGGDLEVSLPLSYGACVTYGEPSIFTNEFYVYVTREEVKFDISVKNMANSLDNLTTITENENKVPSDYYDNGVLSTPVGGVVGMYDSAETSAIKLDVSKLSERGKTSNDLLTTSTNGLQRMSFYGWDFKGFSFRKAEITNGSASSLSSSVELYDSTKDFWVQYMKWKYSTLTTNQTVNGVKYEPDLDNDGGNNSNLQFIIYSYHLLGTYSLTTKVEVDGALGELSGSDNFTITTNEGMTGDSGETTSLTFGSASAGNVHYFANVEIKELNKLSVNHYVFEGYYLRITGQTDKLLTNEKTLHFSNDNSFVQSMLAFYGGDYNFQSMFGYSLDSLGSKNQVTQLTIVAKYNKVTAVEASDLTASRKVYTIRTKNDLIKFSQMVNSGTDFENCIVNQVADIDLSGVVFNPIGNLNRPFKGIYNGNDHLIKNLKTSGGNGADVAYRGLFGHTAGATIKNLTIYSGFVYGGSSGAVVGYALGTTFERVNNYGCKINDKSINHFTIYNEAVATPDGEKRKTYGGLVGLAEHCKFFACSNRAQVGFSGSTEEKVAGLIGDVTTTTVLDQCFNEGAVYGQGALGLANATIATITNCYYRYTATGEQEAYYNSSGAPISEPAMVDAVWAKINNKTVLRVFYWY